MFYESELVFLRKILDKCHLQALILDPTKPLDERIDNGLRKLFDGHSGKETFFDFFPEILENTVYRVTDVFWCRYIFFELPFLQERRILFIGPFVDEDLTRQQLMEKAESSGLPAKMFKELELFYTSLPVIREENHVLAMINAFGEHLWGADGFESVDINLSDSAAFMPLSARPRALADDGMLTAQIVEARYNYENELINAVSQGNIHKAELMLANFSTLALENRTPDQLRNVKNYCIIMNTLFRKAAETGGVHPVHIDTVSSDFAKKIETTRSLEAIYKLMPEILRSYCRLVKKQSVKKYSPLVQKAIMKIETDLTGDLSLKAMAQMNNVSPAYFSNLFKSVTGQTLTDYVNTKRISLAKHLLKNTSLQVQTIAQHCGILDFHYFCRLFKGVVGKTPTEYRKGFSFE